MKDIKQGIKLMKYAAQFKTNMFCAALICIIGFATEYISKGEQFVGGFYILLMGIFPMQLIFSLDLSNMVQTSKFKRKIQVVIPTKINFIMMTVAATVLVVIRAYECNTYPELRPAIINNLVFIAILSVLFLAYMGAAFKYFIQSFVSFMVVMMAINLYFTIKFMDTTAPIVSLPVAIVITYVCVFAGIGLQYLFLSLFYKKEMSKFAYGAQMRKLMK